MLRLSHGNQAHLRAHHLRGVRCGSILATTFSQRLRDLAFLGMVCFSVYAEKLDVNFFGRYWYRGTSRGMGVSVTDILAWSILISSVLANRRAAGESRPGGLLAFKSWIRGRAAWLPPGSSGFLVARG